MEEEAILTIKEVAERAGVGTQKIHRDIHNGKLKAFKLGWQWLINESDCISYLETQSKVTNS